MAKRVSKETLLSIYQRLLVQYGPQNWWPAGEPFEVMVGAILTQSTSWTNVEKSIINLKKAGALSPQALRNLSQERLAVLIHPCGYFNMKAIKLQAFAGWFGVRFDDSLAKMFSDDAASLRRELLEVHGIGEETADSMLLYAGNKPVFVIDAYTRRILDRLGLKPENGKYGDYQKLFMNNLPYDAQLFNEYHALLVALGKNLCLKTNPLCEECCLNDICKRNI